VSAEKFRSLKKEVCEPCILAKQTRSCFPKVSESHTNCKPPDLLHMNLCGPMQGKSLGGSRYIVNITDDARRCSIVKFLLERGQAKKAITQVVKQLQRQLGSKVKEIRTDRGRELLNEEMAQFSSEEGIIHELTCPYTPEQNGVAEHLNRTLLEKARAMISDAGLSSKLWAEAVDTEELEILEDQDDQDELGGACDLLIFHACSLNIMVTTLSYISSPVR
jgi:hypothetical protein